MPDARRARGERGWAAAGADPRGRVAGSVALKPQGKNKFGWDPIFIPQGYKKTWGEMDEDEIGATSMRRIALAQLQTFLEKQK